MLKVKRMSSKRKFNERGSAVLEMIPVLIVVMVLMRYTYGFFGLIQSATLHSIAARNYAFETFRHRSNLRYLREGSSDLKVNNPPFKKGTRVHGIGDRREKALVPIWYVERMPILYPFSEQKKEGPRSLSSRMSQQANLDPKKRFSEGDGTDYVWLAIRYGMCIDGPKCN